MTIPGSVADWMQASVMAAALAGLAAIGRSALRDADADAPSSRRLGPSRPPSGPVEATAATEDAEAVRSVPAPTVGATSSANSGSAGRPSIDGR